MMIARLISILVLLISQVWAQGVPSPPTALAVDVYRAVPEIPGNGIDDNLVDGIDEAITPCWTANSADYYCEAEDAQLVTPMVSAADTDASGGDYVHLPLGEHFSSAQMRLPGTSITNATYYLFARVRNPGGTKRFWLDTSTIGRYPDNSNIGGTIPQRESFTWELLGTAGSLSSFSQHQNNTAQRTVALNGTIALSLMSEPGIQWDKFCISPNANAIAQGATDATICSSAAPVTVNYEVLDIGAVAMPTADGTIDTLWAQVPAVNYNGVNANATWTTRAVWDKDSTPKRMCLLHTGTLAGSLSTTATDDNTTVTDDTALFFYAKFSNLNRTRDLNTYLMGINHHTTQSMYDATWPDNVFSLTADLGNVTRGRSYTGNVVIIETCFDIPGTPTVDQQFLLNIMANERTAGGTVSRHAFSTSGSPADIAGWGVGKLSSTVVPAAPADSTAPVVTNCSAINTGNNTFDARCDTNEAGTGLVQRDTDNDSAVSGADLVSTGTVNCSGATCTINVSGLTQGTLYEWKLCVTDGAGNQGCGAVIDTTTTATTNRFVSVSGTGTEAGTNCADTNDTTRCPLSQIAARASAGETWLVKNGTYPIATTGRININCAAGGTGAVNGTASQPVTVKAENERQAWIQGDGSGIPLEMKNCSWWRVEGLRLTQADLNSGGNTGNNVLLWSVHNFVFRRNLLQFNNRYKGGASFANETAMTNSLIEENELYDYHRNGMAISINSNNNIIRRNYINSRNRADIPGGYVSGDAGQGDTGFACYPCDTNIFENNIVEKVGAAIDMIAGGSHDNQILGHISIGSWRGVNLVARGSTADTMPQDNFFQNFVAINMLEWGFSSVSAKNTRCDNCTFINNGGGYRAVRDPNAGFTGDGFYSIYGDNLLAYNNNTNGNLNRGLNIETGVGSWTFLIDYMNSFGHGTNFLPAATHASITNELSIDPQMGSCKLWIPAASPMKGAGKGGADIGANILYAYQNGVLTTNKLFDTTTNKWKAEYMGAIVSGVNSDTSNSLTGVFARLNVGTANGCAFPAGY